MAQKVKANSAKKIKTYMAELAPNLKIKFSKKITMHENIFRA